MEFLTTALAVYGGLVIAARAIVKVTATPKDDAILAKVEALVSKFTGISR